MSILETAPVQQLSQIVEESTRSTREGAKYFIEPALNTLARAKSKRHHIIFGRRGSGKSSLLAKVALDLTSSRIPNAYIDLEKFKGHSYPDVLISVLIEATFTAVSVFCVDDAKANCFLVDKDLQSRQVEQIAELVDLKFLHHVKSRVTVRDRPNRVFDAYMLDLSQYAGERARRNFEIVEFWAANADDSLRKTKLIFAEHQGRTASS